VRLGRPEQPGQDAACGKSDTQRSAAHGQAGRQPNSPRNAASVATHGDLSPALRLRLRRGGPFAMQGVGDREPDDARDEDETANLHAEETNQ
jgi:hypothetical protein